MLNSLYLPFLQFQPQFIHSFIIPLALYIISRMMIKMQLLIFPLRAYRIASVHLYLLYTYICYLFVSSFSFFSQSGKETGKVIFQQLHPDSVLCCVAFKLWYKEGKSLPANKKGNNVSKELEEI